jgi:hypothetical protein
MKTTKVNLPPSAAGQNVQLRWRCVTEGRLVRAGWFVDTIAVDEFECPNPIGSPFLLRPTLTGNLFQFSFDAVRGRTFVVEYENSLNESNWQTLQTILGNGSIHTITDRVDRVQQRFFRFRAE